MEETLEHPRLTSFEIDGIVNRVAGEICTLLNNELDSYGDCFFLIPAVSFEVKKPLQHANKNEETLWAQRDLIADEIGKGVRKVLLSCNFSEVFVDKTAKGVGCYVLSLLKEAFKNEPKLVSLN